MKRPLYRGRTLPGERGGARWGLRLVLTLGAVTALAYLAWPYATLWRLDRALADADPTALASLVDLDAIRSEIKKKLNKDSDSAIGAFSDPFIRWLEAGILVEGTGAVDRLVTLEWTREQLLRSGLKEGLLSQISYAFFDAPDGFRLTIGTLDIYPVQARLSLRDFAWRVSAVYY